MEFSKLRTSVLVVVIVFSAIMCGMTQNNHVPTVTYITSSAYNYPYYNAPNGAAVQTYVVTNPTQRSLQPSVQTRQSTQVRNPHHQQRPIQSIPQRNVQSRPPTMTAYRPMQQPSIKRYPPQGQPPQYNIDRQQTQQQRPAAPIKRPPNQSGRNPQQQQHIAQTQQVFQTRPPMTAYNSQLKPRPIGEIRNQLQQPAQQYVQYRPPSLSAYIPQYKQPPPTSTVGNYLQGPPQQNVQYLQPLVTAYIPQHEQPLPTSLFGSPTQNNIQNQQPPTSAYVPQLETSYFGNDIQTQPQQHKTQGVQISPQEQEHRPQINQNHPLQAIPVSSCLYRPVSRPQQQCSTTSLSIPAQVLSQQLQQQHQPSRPTSAPSTTELIAEDSSSSNFKPIISQDVDCQYQPENNGQQQQCGMTLKQNPIEVLQQEHILYTQQPKQQQVPPTSVHNSPKLIVQDSSSPYYRPIPLQNLPIVVPTPYENTQHSSNPTDGPQVFAPTPPNNQDIFVPTSNTSIQSDESSSFTTSTTEKTIYDTLQTKPTHIGIIFPDSPLYINKNMEQDFSTLINVR